MEYLFIVWLLISSMGTPFCFPGISPDSAGHFNSSKDFVRAATEGRIRVKHIILLALFLPGVILWFFFAQVIRFFEANLANYIFYDEQSDLLLPQKE